MFSIFGMTSGFSAPVKFFSPLQEPQKRQELQSLQELQKRQELQSLQ
jgi:hypothetical protein